MQVTIWPRDPGTRAIDAPKGGPGGIFFSDLGEIQAVTTSTRLEEGFGGFDTASWTVRMHPGYVGGFFLPRDHIEIIEGGVPLFSGEFSEQELKDRDPKLGNTYTFHARGYAHVLGDYESICYQAITGGDDYSFITNQLATSDTDTTYAWDYARQNGMQVWADPSDLPTGPFGETSLAPKPIKLRDLLTAHVLRAGKWWACWGPILDVFTMPTTPTLLYDQPSTIVAVADTDYYSAVGLYFIKTAPGTSVDQCTVVWGGEDDRTHNIYDRREIVLDMRGLGLQPTADMGDLAQTMYEQVKGRRLLTGSLALVGHDSGLKAANGGAADIEAVRAGDVMKMTEVRDSLGFLMPDGETKFVVGSTQHEWDDDGLRVTITPMGAVPRNFSDVLKDAPLDSTAEVAGA